VVHPRPLELVEIASVVSVLSVVLVVSFVFVSLVSIVVFRSCIPQEVADGRSFREGSVRSRCSRLVRARVLPRSVDIRMK
jgi:hypothetical protein